MPALANQRHEKFVQALFQGKPQNAAYEEAGYRYHEGNASRLRSNEKIVSRLAELQEQARKASEITFESLVAELEIARSKAVSLDQLSAAVKATSEKARLAGLHAPQRIEVSYNVINELRVTESIEDIADALLRGYNCELSEKERGEFVEVLRRYGEALADFLVPRLARTIDITPQKPASEYERRRLEYERRKNNGRY